MERLVKFEVLGQEYPLHTDAPEEDVREILHLVKSQLEDNSQPDMHILPANKLAVLLSLNMAGKYVRLKREFGRYKQQVDNHVDRLAQKIESSL